MDDREKEHKRKKRDAILAGAVVLLFLAGAAAFLTVAWPVSAFHLAVIVIVMVCLLFVLWSRLREIDRGEEDEAMKY